MKRLFNKKLNVLGFIILYKLIMPHITLAASGNNIQIVDILTNIYNFCTGTIAATIAGLVTVFVGYQVLVTGQLDKRNFWSCVVGFGLLFGSKAITNMLGVTH